MKVDLLITQHANEMQLLKNAHFAEIEKLKATHTVAPRSSLKKVHVRESENTIHESG